MLTTICNQVECASLNQELQDMEARARRSQKKSPEEANQVIQVQLQIQTAQSQSIFTCNFGRHPFN